MWASDTVSEWLRRWTRNPLGFARRGSNPLGVGFVLVWSEYPKALHGTAHWADRAAIAQLGERETEDLEVLGSIPSCGIFPCVLLIAQAKFRC
jgi:hypothetical protein